MNDKESFVTPSQKLYAIDVETDGLDNASTIHFVVIREPDGAKQVWKNLIDDKLEVLSLFRFLESISNGGVLVGHNIIGFDNPTLSRLVPSLARIIGKIPVIDTLVVSRLINFKRLGGHSLESYGHEFKFEKVGVEITDWSRPTPLMLERCKSDVDLTYKIVEKYHRFLCSPEWGDALRSEHYAAKFAQRITEAGFRFDVPKAKKMLSGLSRVVSDELNGMSEAFPPKWVLWRRVEPRKTKSGRLNVAQFKWLLKDEEYEIDDGTSRTRIRGNSDGPLDLSAFDGKPFDVYKLQEFNPASPRQIVERLNDFGWKPTEKTKGHLDAVKNGAVTQDQELYGWKVSETNLATLPDTAPASAFKLAQYLTLVSRVSDLEEWLELVRDDGKIHGRLTSIGAWTQRVSHQNPNTANIPQAKPSATDTPFVAKIQILNGQMRELWIASEGKRLIGTDADGVQMRIFAHLCNDKALIEALESGRKEDGTDIHSLDRKLLGPVCGSRDVAKTFIYAFLLGAGAAKIAEILGCSIRDAKGSVLSFIEALPGLTELKQTRIPVEAAQGYFVGLDGRKVICDSEHLMLSGHLQNGEKVIMTRWCEKWTRELERLSIPYKPVGWVHDEVTIEIPDDAALTEAVQEIQLQAMVDVGHDLEMNCELKATSKTGYNWHEIH